jgi:hypothetical protein
LSGVTKQLEFAAKGNIALVAACSEQMFEFRRATIDPPPRMMHIWQVPDWSSLYDAMYFSSETTWYDKLESSVDRESQELLVELRVTYGVDPAPPVPSASVVYMYEELHLKGHRIPTEYLRALNQFAAIVRERGWKWIWSASQVTSEPQVLCLLWSAPTVDTFHETLAEVRGEQVYETMMGAIDSVDRTFMFPTEVESIASRISRA